MLSKASSEAMNVAVEAGIMTDKTLPIFIGRASASMLGLASKLDSSALDEELASQLGAAATAAAATTPVVEETESAPAEAEEEEEDEPEEFGGLGDLFG